MGATGSSAIPSERVKPCVGGGVVIRPTTAKTRVPTTSVTAKGSRGARKLETVGSFSVAEWLALVELWGGRCAYCGDPAPLEIDHRVPLSRGGTNSIENILPACGPCNRRKYAMSEDEFRARLAAESRGGGLLPPSSVQPQGEDLPIDWREDRYLRR